MLEDILELEESDYFDEEAFERDIESEYEQLLRQLPRDKRAYLILKSFMSIENPTEQLHRSFFRWLLDPSNEEAKINAFSQILREEAACEEATTAGEPSRNRLEALRCVKEKIAKMP